MNPKKMAKAPVGLNRGRPNGGPLVFQNHMASPMKVAIARMPTIRTSANLLSQVKVACLIAKSLGCLSCQFSAASQSFYQALLISARSAAATPPCNSAWLLAGSKKDRLMQGRPFLLGTSLRERDVGVIECAVESAALARQPRRAVRRPARCRGYAGGVRRLELSAGSSQRASAARSRPD